MHYNSNMHKKQIEMNKCKILSFSRFRGLMPGRYPFFLISRIRASRTHFGRELGGGGVGVLLCFHTQWAAVFQTGAIVPKQ